MKLLLDENLPKKLKSDFPDHLIYTVHDMGWNGRKNGELQLLIDNSFDALITFDKNLQFQQNFKIYSFPIVVLNAHDNTYLTLKNLVSRLKFVLKDPLKPGITEIS